ncbi:MAG: helix-hairpin-helix domain-containing protein [Clostridia bacterium]|nr:helix-hairpin-helix domain-containing protein [Clostridia bacterium]
MLFFKGKGVKKTEILEKIPGVEPECAIRLKELGYTSVSQLKKKDAEEMYYKVCIDNGSPVDKTLLYQFRCAIYYATVKQADPKKLHWWYWKDSNANNSVLSDEELIKIYEEV